MKPIVIHQTDLFHSCNDPDDHWDLACQYALAFRGAIDLHGILIDDPPMDFGDPAIQAVSQMNYITGLAVPAAVGMPEHPQSAAGPGASGVNLVLATLERAAEPVVIHIVGSCRDIAAAVSLNPGLFREACGAIYLNAGASSPESKPEYNVALDPLSFAKVLDAPCPVYWLPCFERAPEPPDWRFDMGPYGTYYRFNQGEILPSLSDAMKKYFVYALGKITDNRWLSYLKDPLNERLFKHFCRQERSMYCTAGFFHAAGLTVTAQGDIVGLGETEKPVFTFEPVEITCDGQGNALWRQRTRQTTEKSSSRYLFHAPDPDRYQTAMTRAMKTLLSRLP